MLSPSNAYGTCGQSSVTELNTVLRQQRTHNAGYGNLWRIRSASDDTQSGAIHRTGRIHAVPACAVVDLPDSSHLHPHLRLPTILLIAMKRTPKRSDILFSAGTVCHFSQNFLSGSASVARCHEWASPSSMRLACKSCGTTDNYVHRLPRPDAIHRGM